MNDKPNGKCRCCGARLNEYLVGGYKLHHPKDEDGAVDAFINMSKEMCIDYRNLINKRLQKIRRNK